MALTGLLVGLLMLTLIGRTGQYAVASLKGESTRGYLDIHAVQSAKKILSGIENPDTIDTQELLIDVHKMTESAKSEIFASFIIISKSEQIANAFYTVHSLLKDLERLIEANNQTRKTFQVAYVENYKTNNVEVSIRVLSQLLTFAIPGTSGKLLPAFVEQHRCNMTAFYKFKEFYFNLFSVGVTLNLVYLSLDRPQAMQTSIENWRNYSSDSVRIVDREQLSCEDKLYTYASEDLEQENNARQLWDANKERYNPKWNDVMFFPRIGSEQAQFFKYVKGNVLHKTSNDINKIVIIGNYCDMCSAAGVNTLLERSKEAIRGVVSGKDDMLAAKKLADTIHTILDENRRYLSALIVFFDGDDHTPELIFDEESHVASLIIEDVTIKVCYPNTTECWARDPTENVHTVHGQFRVYAYPATTPARMRDEVTTIRKVSKYLGRGLLGLDNGGWGFGGGGGEHLHETSDAVNLFGCYGLAMAIYTCLLIVVI